MITAIVQFDLPDGIGREQAFDIFTAIAPNYTRMPGLIHKYFCYSKDGKGAGIYLWKSRAAANRVYAGVWRKRIKKLYGVEPEIQFYEPLLVVDNAAGEIRAAPRRTPSKSAASKPAAAKAAKSRAKGDGRARPATAKRTTAKRAAPKRPATKRTSRQVAAG